MREHANGVGRAVPVRAVLSWTAVLTIFVLASPARAQTDVPLVSGLGLGGSIGINSFGGDANREISSARGWQMHLSAAMRRGWYLRAGVTLSSHDIAGESAPWQFRSFFLEPRWFAVSLWRRAAPFIAIRAGHVAEEVSGRTWELRASGTTWGAGGGVTFRVAPQISVEAGAIVGGARFGAWDFTGELAWKACLDDLGTGTPLPASVSQCAGSRSLGGVVTLCYPPYFTERTSNCSPPEIPYADTGRSGHWTQLWIGLSLALSSGSTR